MKKTQNKYNQGDRIYFSLGEKLPAGWGKVCGVFGPIIIVELEKSIEGYDYTHIYVIDQQIQEAPVDA